jgi:hypothetical protein
MVYFFLQSNVNVISRLKLDKLMKYYPKRCCYNEKHIQVNVYTIEKNQAKLPNYRY